MPVTLRRYYEVSPAAASWSPPRRRPAGQKMTAMHMHMAFSSRFGISENGNLREGRGGEGRGGGRRFQRYDRPLGLQILQGAASRWFVVVVVVVVGSGSEMVSRFLPPRPFRSLPPLAADREALEATESGGPPPCRRRRFPGDGGGPVFDAGRVVVVPLGAGGRAAAAAGGGRHPPAGTPVLVAAVAFRGSRPAGWSGCVGNLRRAPVPRHDSCSLRINNLMHARKKTKEPKESARLLCLELSGWRPEPGFLLAKASTAPGTTVVEI
uniref:Uncharacterized protein n=1 Tax=Oryza brachyantha TaxID=4533 RepID=J3N3E1_ORYBR